MCNVRSTTFVDEQSLDYSLPWARSLQTIEITAASIDDALTKSTQDLLECALSSLQSPLFSQVVVIYQEFDFRGIEVWKPPKWPYLRQISRKEREVEASWHRERFKLLREVHKTRNFELVLRADVWGPVAEYAVRMLEEAVAAEKAEKGFDDFSSEPLVVYDPHRGLRSVATPRPSPSPWSVV